MTRKRLLQYLSLGAALVIVLVVAVAAFASLKVPFSVPTATASSRPCSPQPCADVRGFTLWVSGLQTQGGLVSMQLRFENKSAATHADPTEIQLIDSTGHPNQRVTDALGCTAWARKEFSNGATFGPVPECFRPANANPPLRLHWEPDFGPFCCEIDIPLQQLPE